MALVATPSGKKIIAAACGGVLAVCAIMAIIGVQSSAVATESAAPRAGAMAGFTLAPAGVRAPLTPFTDEKGTKLTLADFRGRVVLVNFWATWCAPCVREMPSLERLQAKLGGADFTVVALSEDRDGWQKIAPFRERLGLRALPLYHDTGSAMMFAIKAGSLPTTILYDRKGTEIGRLALPAEWDSPEAISLIRRHIGE